MLSFDHLVYPSRFYPIFMPLILKFSSIILISITLCTTTSYAGGYLHRGNIGEPDSLDPHLTTSGYAGNIIFDMFLGLTTLDAFANIVPGAAKSWTISKDGKTYIFAIREGMQWSDGRLVTAGDFEYAFRRILDPLTASRSAPMLYAIKNARLISGGKLPVDQLGVEALDDFTLEIKLEAPTPFFLELIVHRGFPVPKWTIEEYGREWTRPENIVVNGAFILKQWIPQTSLSLEKNQLFFWNDSVALSGVTYYTTEDLTSAFNRYRSGELDIIISFPPSQFEWIQQNMARELRVSQNNGLEYITFNTLKPPFDDSRVRLALSMVVDRDLIAARVMRGGERPAHSIVPEASRGPYDPALPLYISMAQAERVTRAKVLLREAGFGPDNPLSLSFRYNTHEVLQRVAAAVAAMWDRDLGVSVTLLNSDLNTLNADLRNGNYEVARYQWLGEYRDPSTFLYLLQSDAVGDNHSKYNNSDFDALMNAMYDEPDLDKRFHLMKAAEKIVMADAPITPITYYVSKRLVGARIRGFEDNVRGINLSRYVSINDL
ncbi:MAG: peptide ABC transporter substrate-binding protein [Rhodospirillaceae bacterium]